MRFRIVEYVHCVNELGSENGSSRIEYVIEKKKWLCGWKEVFHKELKSKRISHKTYKDAEAYLMTNYMGHGVCRKIGNYYHYTEYVYNI